MNERPARINDSIIKGLRRWLGPLNNHGRTLRTHIQLTSKRFTVIRIEIRKLDFPRLCRLKFDPACKTLEPYPTLSEIALPHGQRVVGFKQCSNNLMYPGPESISTGALGSHFFTNFHIFVIWTLRAWK